MSDSLTDLLVTDAQLDMVAAREHDGVHDLVLAGLALLAAAVDHAPLPPVIKKPSRPAMTNSRKGGWALSVIVALMITSSGIAAAVSNDPLAPLHYVINHVWEIGPHNNGQLPGWELDGSMPISTSALEGVHGPRVGRLSRPGRGTTQAGSGLVRTSGSSGVVPGSAGGSVGGTGYGGSPSLGSGGEGRNPEMPPNDSHGQVPGRIGGPPDSGSGSLGGPLAPTHQITPDRLMRPGDESEPGGYPGQAGYGRVPGTGDDCNVDGSGSAGVPTPTGSDAAARLSCGTHDSTPTQPSVPTSPTWGGTSPTPTVFTPSRWIP
jgi:hypothetical protein